MRTTADGIVIGTLNTNDSDRLVTILTGESGVLRAMARGAKKPGSKLCGSTELLCYSRFVLFSYRGRVTVDAADVNRAFWGIRRDVVGLSLAAYLCELSADTSPAQSPAREYLRLMLNCLHMLETGRRPPAFIKPVFELRQIAMAGYQPDLVGCALCGAYEGEGFAFFPAAGEIYCASCQERARREGAVTLSSAALAAMRHILYADASRLFSFSLSGPGLRELGAVCERFIQAQLARTFQTLTFYHSLAPAGSGGLDT